jgi:hypothetical protein
MSPNQPAPFRNRKGTLNQNVMVVCDFYLKITYVSAGWEGLATDSMVLRSAMGNPVGKFEVPEGLNRDYLEDLMHQQPIKRRLKELYKGYLEGLMHQQSINKRRQRG